MKLFKRAKSSLSFNIIGVVIAILVIFGLIVSVIGVISFTRSFKKEYAESTYHMADTATTLINGDHLEAYLDGEYPEEYAQSLRYLNSYCTKIHVSLIYVIVVDRSDYGRFVSVFNSVDNSVDNTSYTPWELGFKRDTTNDEYRTKYKRLYDKESLYETLYRIKTTDGQHPHITTMVPVKDSAGDVVGILCMQRPARELSEARRPYLISVAITSVLMGLIACLSAVFMIRFGFINPIKKVSKEASRFAREKSKGEELGAVSRYEVLADLAGSIDTMETDMVNYVKDLTEITAEKERIGAELNFAKSIQEESLPNDFPAFPDRTEFDLFASMDPAKEVGGDFYNFFLIDDDHLALVIGDVSGKGIPAALFMMVTNILITIRTRMGGTPAQILEFVNNELCEHNKAEMFCTIWLAIVEISTGKVTEANAGHENPVIYRKGGKYEEHKTKHNIAVGTMGGLKFRDYEFELAPGDKIFTYTDGVPEATNANEKMYGMTRLVDMLNSLTDRDMQQTAAGVRKDVDAFVGEAPQFDDLTILGFEYKGKN